MKKFALIAALVAVPLVVLAQPVVPGCPSPAASCSRANFSLVDAGQIYVSNNATVGGTASVVGPLNATFVDAGYVVGSQFRSTIAGDYGWSMPSGSFMCFNYPTCSAALRAGAVITTTHLGPDSNNTYDFGTSANRWRHSYFSGEMSVAVIDAGWEYVAGDVIHPGHTMSLYTDAGTVNVGALTMNRKISDSATAPTVTACSGGTAASITWSNGTGAFVFDVGTACTGESTAVITLPATNNGWLCSCSVTTADRMLQQKVIPPANGTTVTMQHITISTGANTDFTDSADVGCICRGG